MATSTVMSKDELDELTITEISKVCSIPIDNIEEIYSCTPLQIATIVESALHTGTSVFQFVFTLAPSIDLDRLCLALQQVIVNNSILRTRFVDTRYGLLQVVVGEPHRTERITTVVRKYLETDKAQKMGLGMSLFRSAIIDRNLIITVHHGVMDHASLSPLFEDMLTVYHGGKPRERATFRDFIIQCLKIDDSTARAFWEPRFRGIPAVFPRIGSDHVPLATQIVTQRIELKRLDPEFSVAHIPSFLEIAWAMTSSTYSSSESVAFGIVLSGRTSGTAAETTLGPTIAVLPVQVTLKDTATLDSVLRETATSRRQLQSHPALQYGLTRIRALNEAARIASGFQTLLNIRPRWYDPKEASDVAFDYMSEPHEAFALVLSCDLEDAAVSVRAVYDPKVLCETQIQRVLHQFEHFLQSLVEVPRRTKLGQIARIGSHDLSEIINWNGQGQQRTSGEKCVHELFSATSKEQPTAMAVDAHDGSATYGELDEMSDNLALYLRQKDVSTGSPVAFIFEKSFWTIVVILGIMKAGGACIPLAATDPIARKADVITRAGVKTVLTSHSEYEGSVGLAPTVTEISRETISNLATGLDLSINRIVSPNNLAFILFTSGSTGLPKGVMLEHRNIASSLQTLIPKFGWGAGSRMLQFASHVWDTSIGEMLGALLSGGCLCIPSEESRYSDLANYIESNNVNCAFLTPTVLRTLLPGEVPGLKCLISAGEAVSPDASRTWGRDRRFFNGWGPCEASILSCVAELTPESPYPDSIGNPVNGAIWIVNPRNPNELTPIGAAGEMLISGPGVAQGYLKDDAKTRLSFIKPPPWAPEQEKTRRHFYRTGDLAKYNPDGTISFIGRKDSQVKIRGQRLELGEVEGVITGCERIRDIFVTTKISEGRTELVAVMSLANSSLPRTSILQELTGEYSEVSIAILRAVRDYARAKLPSYMVPTIWIAVQDLPRTASTKLDRVAISQWLKTQNISLARTALDDNSAASLTPPRTDDEKLLQSVWSSILGTPVMKIGCESIFGQLGGDSILAMQVVGQARKRGLRVSTAQLLKNMSLATIAEASSRIQLATESGPEPGSQETPHDDDWDSEEAVAISTKLSRLNPRINHEDVEAVVLATYGQSTMIAVGETGGRGYHIDFDLDFKPHLDLTSLRTACERVIKNHSILRTVFVCHGASLYQVVLKAVPPDMVLDHHGEYTTHLSFSQGAPLACFHLISDGQGSCRRLVFEVHHALYDAMSLGLIFRDLDAAYAGRPLSGGPDYYTWVSHTKKLDISAAKEFWTDVLQDATMPFLVPPVPGGVRGHPLDQQVLVRVPLKNIKTPLGTPSSVLKTAWSLILSFALQRNDVVFGEVSANRFLPFPDIEGVKGPCVNVVPVRARLDPETSIASLITQIQDLFVSGMPHHHLETGTLLSECTPSSQYPHWTRFSTAIVYQNHESLAPLLRIGGAETALSSRGKLGDSTDVHLIAMPGTGSGSGLEGEELLDIEIRYSPQTIPSEQIRWIARALTTILNSLPAALEAQKTVGELEADFRGVVVDPYVVPPPLPPPSSAPALCSGYTTSGTMSSGCSLTTTSTSPSPSTSGGGSGSGSLSLCANSNSTHDNSSGSGSSSNNTSPPPSPSPLAFTFPSAEAKAKALEVVSRAWEEVGLKPHTQPQPQSHPRFQSQPQNQNQNQNQDQGQNLPQGADDPDVSMWDNDKEQKEATVLTALLLAESYRASGYRGVSAGDIVGNPSRLAQAALLAANVSTGQRSC